MPGFIALVCIACRVGPAHPPRCLHSRRRPSKTRKMRVPHRWSVLASLCLVSRLAVGAESAPSVEQQAAAAYQRGTELAAAGDHAGAVAAFDAALRLEPASPTVRNDLGVELYLSGDLARAERELRAVLDADPTRGLARVNLAFVLYDRGDIDQAVTQWRTALEQGARVADAYAGLALGLFKQGKTAEAIETYRLAIDRHADYARLDYLTTGEAGWSRHAAADADGLLRALQRAAPAPTP